MMAFLMITMVFAESTLSPIQSEMNRAMQELALPEQPKPYWIGTHAQNAKIEITFSSNGHTLTTDLQNINHMQSNVRIGAITFDNWNFDGSGNPGAGFGKVPLDANPLFLKHQTWLALDAAYKHAVEMYSEKSAAWDGREYPDTPEMLPLEEIVITPELSQPEITPWTENFANQVSSVFAQYPFLDNNYVMVSHAYGVKHFISTENQQSSIPLEEVIVRMEVNTRAQDGSNLRSTRSWVVKTPEQLPSMEALQKEAQHIAQWVQLLQTAPIEEDYLGPVIFEEQPSVELFRQLLQPQISGTPPASQMPDWNGEIPRIVPVSRLGRRLLPEDWSVIDDATSYPDEVGSYDYDEQGVAPKMVQVIDDGIVKDLLMSRVPRGDISHSTGHGRSFQGYRCVAIPSVVTVSPKKHKSQKQLHRKGLKMAEQAGLDYVLLVKHIETLAMTTQMEVAFSGDEQLSGLTNPTEIVRLYADGHEEPIRGASFVGVNRKVLRDIVAAGPQSDFIGMMDSDSQRYMIGYTGGVPTSWSVPTVLIAEMELRGQGGQELHVLPMPTMDSISKE